MQRYFSNPVFRTTDDGRFLSCLLYHSSISPHVDTEGISIIVGWGWFNERFEPVFTASVSSLAVKSIRSLLPRISLRNMAAHFHHLFIYLFIYSLLRSRGSVVGIATGYELDDWGVGVRVLVRSRTLSSPNRLYRLWGPHNLLSNVYQGALSPGVKLPVYEADHSPPTSAKSRKCGSIHPFHHTPSRRSA
jgi:hypothetical protein